MPERSVYCLKRCNIYDFSATVKIETNVAAWRAGLNEATGVIKSQFVL